jgi:hypothetical protein
MYLVSIIPSIPKGSTEWMEVDACESLELAERTFLYYKHHAGISCQILKETEWGHEELLRYDHEETPSKPYGGIRHIKFPLSREYFTATDLLIVPIQFMYEGELVIGSVTIYPFDLWNKLEEEGTLWND